MPRRLTMPRGTASGGGTASTGADGFSPCANSLYWRHTSANSCRLRVDSSSSTGWGGRACERCLRGDRLGDRFGLGFAAFTGAALDSEAGSGDGPPSALSGEALGTPGVMGDTDMETTGSEGRVTKSRPLLPGIVTAAVVTTSSNRGLGDLAGSGDSTLRPLPPLLGKEAASGSGSRNSVCRLRGTRGDSACASATGVPCHSLSALWVLDHTLPTGRVGEAPGATGGSTARVRDEPGGACAGPLDPSSGWPPYTALARARNSPGVARGDPKPCLLWGECDGCLYGDVLATICLRALRSCKADLRGEEVEAGRRAMMRPMGTSSHSSSELEPRVRGPLSSPTACDGLRLGSVEPIAPSRFACMAAYDACCAYLCAYAGGGGATGPALSPPTRSGDGCWLGGPDSGERCGGWWSSLYRKSRAREEGPREVRGDSREEGPGPELTLHTRTAHNQAREHVQPRTQHESTLLSRATYGAEARHATQRTHLLRRRREYTVAPPACTRADARGTAAREARRGAGFPECLGEGGPGGAGMATIGGRFAMRSTIACCRTPISFSRLA